MPDGKFVSIPWGDETQDCFYMDFSSIVNSNIIRVSSDTNSSGKERTKILVFKGAMPDGSSPEYQASAYLKVVQQIDGLVVATFENVTSVYQNQKAGYQS